MQSRHLAGYFLGFLGVVIFGGTLPMTRIAMVTLDPWFVTFGRAAFAGLLAIPVLFFTGRRLPPGSAGTLLLIAAMLVIGFPALMALALQTVPAAHGGVVLGVLPIATALAAVLITGERPTPLFWALSLTGAAIVVTFSFRQGGGALRGADLLLAGAAACAATGYALSGRLTRTMPGWAVISWALVLALPLTIPACAYFFQPHYLDAPPVIRASFLYLSVFSMFIGFFAWNAGLALGGIAHVGQIQLLQIFVTLAIAALVAGESITWTEIGYAAAVTLVVALTMRARRRVPTAKAVPAE